MGVGSQRAGIEHETVRQTFRVRDVAPDILLFANLGAVQFNYGYTVDQCRRAVEMIDADALILHLNPLQEAVQPEGDVNWRGLLDKIADVCAHWASRSSSRKWAGGSAPGGAAADRGWRQRHRRGRRRRHLVEPGRDAPRTDRAAAPAGGAFADWGIPTAESLAPPRKCAPNWAAPMYTSSPAAASAPGRTLSSAPRWAPTWSGWRRLSSRPPWHPLKLSLRRWNCSLPRRASPCSAAARGLSARCEDQEFYKKTIRA
jgi:hypothetical protein